MRPSEAQAAAVEAPPDSQWSLLGQRRFAPLFWVQGLGAFNDQVFKTALLTLLTYRLAERHGLDVATYNILGAALFILPFALLSPTAGQLADGVDKAKMMKVMKGVEVGLMVLAAIAYQVQALWMLFVLLFLMGSQSAVFAPIKYGILPQYLRERELVGANGLVQGATFLAILLGQIAGARLILTEGGTVVVGAVVIGVAVVGFLVSLLAPPAPPLGPPPKVDWVLPRALWTTLRDGARVPAAFEAVLMIAWFRFTGATFLTLLPAFAKEVLAGNEDVFIVLLATFSVGVALGAVACAKVFGTEPRMGVAAWGAGGIAAFSLGLWLATGLYVDALPAEAGLRGAGAFLTDPASWLLMACFAALAACAGLYLTPLNALLQVKAPPEARGRFVACSNAADAVAMVGSAGLTAVMVGAGLGEATIFALVGATGIPAALWAIRRR